MAYSVLISAWLVGALGGVHCLTMCGGFMTAIASRDAAAGNGSAPLLPATAIVRQQLAYHAGRLTTYMLLGAAFGATGAVASGLTDLLPVQRGLYVLANIFLVLLALSLATRRIGVGWLQRAGARVLGGALPLLRPVLQRPGATGRIALGLVWGLVPCALVYGVLPLALFGGGAWQGAAVMLAFGLGTLPNLGVTGLLLQRVGPVLDRTPLRFAAAALLFAFASVGIYRALYSASALLTGPYCLVP
jgi:sulfite exporter TauE/SafE